MTASPTDEPMRSIFRRRAGLVRGERGAPLVELSGPTTDACEARITLRRRRLIALLITLQILVPGAVLVMTNLGAWQRPARAGWQMYNSRGSDATVTLLLENGQEMEWDREEGRIARRDLHLTEDRLRRICELEPDALAVRSADGRAAVTCP